MLTVHWRVGGEHCSGRRLESEHAADPEWKQQAAGDTSQSSLSRV